MKLDLSFKASLFYIDEAFYPQIELCVTFNDGQKSMFRLIQFLTYLITISLSWASYAAEVPEQIQDSFVKTKTIYTDQLTKKKMDIYGSGALFNYQGKSFILTASHVVGGNNTRIILHDGEVIFNPSLVAIDNYWDFAVFKLDKLFRSAIHFDEKSDRFIVSSYKTEKCIIPNLYETDKDKKIVELSFNDVTPSSLFYEKVLKSVAIKPRMSGSPLICNGQLVGVLKAFNRIHDISYATDSSLIDSQVLEHRLSFAKEEPFFIKAKWYLYNSELLREYSSKTAKTYLETPNVLNSSFKKNAGGGVRSDGGGSFVSSILDSKNTEKKTDLHLGNYGLVDRDRKQIFSFKALSDDEEFIYFLANESSLVFLQGFNYGFTMYDSFKSIEEVDKSVDLLSLVKKRIVNSNDQIRLKFKPLGECYVSFKSHQEMQLNIVLKSKPKDYKINFDLIISEAGKSDKQLVYKYDEFTKTGVDILGLFFTDLGLLMENDLFSKPETGKDFQYILSSYNLSYIVVKQESQKSVILPCFKK